MKVLSEERILPNSLEGERAILGGMLLDPRYTAMTVAARMKADQFYFAAHQVLYKELVGLIMASNTADVVMLANRLQERGLLEEVGGAVALAELLSSTPTTANVEHYMEIVEHRYIQRQGIQIAHDLMTRCF
jgi:replicative DNA helicase